MLPFVIAILCLFLVGCSSPPSPPDSQEDICAIFEQYPDWYKDAKKMREEWGTPISLAMAFVKQESSFVHDATAPKKYLLGFLSMGPASSSLGYSQAIDGTWEQFEKATNKSWDREKFADSMQFIGWYTNVSHRKLHIPFSDAYSHYLAYHDGHAGFKRKARSQKEKKAKEAVSAVSKRVAKQTQIYKKQLLACQAKFEKKKWWFFG